MTNIYVGNLSYDTSSSDLENAFSQFGQVSRASVVSDRDTGRSKGFGFVEMSDSREAQQAIDGLNDTELQGRKLKVNEAKPREQRSSSRRW
jgi:RNA recognition motif-containing protein